jgi:hypothetical protein
MTESINNMITSSNKQQRSGKSYMHAVLRDAGRPYSYRNTAQRLLQAGGTFRMRAIYGNGFMPVNFRYLHTPYFGHDSGVVGNSFLPAPIPASMPEPGRAKMPEPGRANETLRDLPMKNGMDTGLPQQLAADANDDTFVTPLYRSDSETQDTVQFQPDIKPLAPLVHDAQTIDIRIPDSGSQMRNSDQTSDSKNTKVRRSDDAATPPSDKQTVVSSAARPHITETMLQRLPPDLSLSSLAKALEQHNFRQQDRAAIADEAAIALQAKSGMPQVDTGISEINSSSSQENNTHQAQAVTQYRRAVSGAQHVEPVQQLIEKTRPAPVIAGAMVAAQQPPLKLVTMRKQRTVLSRQEHEQRGNSQQFAETFTDSMNKRMHKVRRQPVRYRQLTVIRQTTPDAFWERSYLARLELRMYR